ncbi:hypothetical protein [Desulfitibacter alkalitolerans]|uniref:hypothetical protein n=1 Tax=Desulfitibacter alkalitolerans TaxID=264641 RepID=UPI000485F636|nr:hypothetical protein [Desulfitibacter alkalitolerans]
MGLSNKYILILVIFFAFFVLLVGCSPSNIGMVDSRDNHDKQIKESTIEDDTDGQNKPEGQTKDEAGNRASQPEPNYTDKNASYAPPKGSFVLGKYSSPNQLNSITLWGWHELNGIDLQVDYILWDWNRKENKKLFTLVKENRRNDKAPVIWLDDNRVLIEGIHLYHVNNQEIKQLGPNEINKLHDYAVDGQNSKIAIVGQNDDYMGVWLIHIETGYIQEASLFDRDYSGDLGFFKVVWGADNTIYFDGVEAGVATIYEYQFDNYELVPLYTHAKLIDFNKQTGSINYLQLESKKSKEREISGSDEERAILKKAADYLNELGFKVGNDPGKISMAVDNIFGDKAVVLYGFWSSEFLGEIVLKKINANWQVDFERQRYYLPYQSRFAEASEFLSIHEGFRYGDEPGKSIIGSPYWNDQLIVFLVGDYGEPWEWEYHVARRNNSWVIDKKIQLKGEVADWWAQGSPTKTVQDFLENIFKENYSLAYNSIHSDGNSLTLEEFRFEMVSLQSKMKSIDFDLGENRVQQKEGLASVQVWFIGERYNQHEIFYGRLELVKVQDSWKVTWPLNILGI